MTGVQTPQAMLDLPEAVRARLTALLADRLGQYSTRYGKIEEIVLGFDVALANGGRLSFPPVPADAVGPELRRLFLGSEGTLGIFTRATLRIRPAPPAEIRAAYAFPSFAEGLDAVRSVLRRGRTRPWCGSTTRRSRHVSSTRTARC